ncbi:hypothetical protein VXS06_09845 [Photobacterium toruni]|uniref:HEPN AbiU2-like domain-containing protein n=1 Tax=Photobacterium toruni TaxID=1935446 RepID=A0ABU6L725_9GAMM|nr:hypothetical protein [Photobacterium toruni]
MDELIIEIVDGNHVFKKGGRKLDSRILNCARSRKVKEHQLIVMELEDVVLWLKTINLQHLQLKELCKQQGEMKAIEDICRSIRANFIAAVVTYQKFFTKCHGISITPLKPEKIYTAEQQDIHGRIDKLRNKLLAHIDHSELLTHKLYAITDPNGEFSPSIYPIYIKANHAIDDVSDKFIQLVEFLISQQNSEYTKSGQALMSTEFGRQ